METIRIYQIYYDEQSKQNLFNLPFITPYLNEHNTKYFENKVISDLIDNHVHLHSKWFGVVSHKWLKSKSKGVLKTPLMYLPKKLETINGVVAFHPFLKNGRIFSGEFSKLYDRIFFEMLKHVGLHTNKQPKNIIMQNHFLAQSITYDQYVSLYLKPAIEFLEKEPKANTIVPYKGYTMHTFLLEKLFMYYVHVHNIKVNYL